MRRPYFIPVCLSPEGRIPIPYSTRFYLIPGLLYINAQRLHVSSYCCLSQQPTSLTTKSQSRIKPNPKKKVCSRPISFFFCVEYGTHCDNCPVECCARCVTNPLFVATLRTKQCPNRLGLGYPGITVGSRPGTRVLTKNTRKHSRVPEYFPPRFGQYHE